MTELTANDLLPRLMAEFNYPPKGAQIVADKLVACTSLIKEIFSHWWQTGELSNIQVEGYTIQQLIEQHSMKPIAAILTLDWLARDPVAAQASLKRKHDYVK